MLLNDSEKAVRWKAMEFISTVPNQLLASALFNLEGSRGDSVLVRELRWLVAIDESDHAMIAAGIGSSSSLHQKFAVSAAVRVAKLDLGPLISATDSKDLEIAQFASDMLKRLS